MIYEVLLVKHPTEKARKDGALEEIIDGPSVFVAKNEQGAALLQMRRLTGLTLSVSDDELARCEVVVRPFGQNGKKKP